MTRPAEHTWASLPAFIDFSGGYVLWDIEMLVRLGGSQKAGARIIEGIEQQLAENHVGHLPAKLPTDSTRPVILYNKDQPNLGIVLSMVAQLASPEVNDNSGTVHQLKILLDTISRTYQPNIQREAAARHAPRATS